MSGLLDLSRPKGWFDSYFRYYENTAKLDGDSNGEPCKSLPGVPQRTHSAKHRSHHSFAHRRLLWVPLFLCFSISAKGEMTIGVKNFSASILLFMFGVACAGESQNIDQTATDTTPAEISDTQQVTATTSASTVESFFSIEALADGQQVATSFEGKGSSDLGSLSVAVDYSLIIASNNGPLKVSIEDSDGSRVVYERPPGTGAGSHQTGELTRGDVSISVQASDQVSWLIVVTGELAPKVEKSENATQVQQKADTGTSGPGSGYNTLYIGHSFGTAFAERLEDFANNSEIVGHSQSIVFRGGNTNGNPEGLWNDETARSEIQEILDQGEIDLLIMICCPNDPRNPASYWGIPKWIDYALTQNPETKFGLALPWLDSPKQYSDAESFANTWNMLHERLWLTVIANMRERYPGTEFLDIPHGAAAVELRNQFEAGTLSDVSALVGNEGAALFRDDQGHPDNILQDLGTLIWLGLIYDVDLSIHPTGDPGNRISRYETDLREIAQSIVTKERER